MHLTAGIIVGASEAAMLISEGKVAGAAAFAVPEIIGSLFPDIDIPNSKLGKVCPLLSGTINRFFGHRGITHTPVFAIFISFLLYLAFNHFSNKEMALYAAAGLMTGILVHLIQDTFTRKGISWLYPFSQKKLSLTRCPSGSRWCMLFTILMLAGWFYALMPFTAYLVDFTGGNIF